MKVYEVVEVGVLVNEFANTTEFGCIVAIVDSDSISNFDTYIGFSNYETEDGEEVLRVYNVDGKLCGYFEEGWGY